MYRQLILKELRLQQSGLMFIFGIVAFWCIMLLLTPFADKSFGICTLGQFLSILQSGIIGGCLLILTPLLLGASMLSEERKYGMWDWQLSLPVSRWRMLLVKIGFGAVVTLILTCVLIPLLDAGMERLLVSAHQSLQVPFFSEILRWNNGYFLLPLLMLVCGAYASSLFNDPSKALLVGGILFCCVIACTWIVDTRGIMLHYWNVPNAFVYHKSDYTSYRMTWWSAPLLILCLLLMITWLVYKNFCFESPRWKKLVWHIALSTTLICIITHFILSEELFPHRTVIVGGYPSKLKFRLGAPTSLNGIEPLLSPRNLGASMGTQITGFGRKANNSNLQVNLCTTVSRKEGNYSIGEFSWYQTGEINPGKRNLRITDTKLWGMANKFGIASPPAIPYYAQQIDQLKLNDLALNSADVCPLDYQQKYYQYRSWIRDANNHTTGGYNLLLLEKDTGDVCRVIDDAGSHPRYWTRYTISPDGKWFTRPFFVPEEKDQPLGLALAQPATIFSTDHTTTWTLSGRVWIRSYGGYIPDNEMEPISNEEYPYLCVSHSGRYLAFQRIQTIQVPSHAKAGGMKDTGCPEHVDNCVLDLQTGKELILSRFNDEMEEKAMCMAGFNELKKMSIWDDWLQAEPGSEAEVNAKTQIQKQVHYNPFRMGRRFMMTWAPDSDRLAIADKQFIHIFDLDSNTPTLVRKIDLGHWGVINMGFWDAKTLLAIPMSNKSLLKIDIEKAGQASHL